MPEKWTDCECVEPGFCARHQCQKSRHHFEMCRRSQTLYQLWEQGQGPCQQWQAETSPSPPRRTPCRHIGMEQRTEACRSCNGHVLIKIFACGLHHECTAIAKLTAIVDCATCGDFESKP